MFRTIMTGVMISLAALTSPAAGQSSWPSKQLRLVVPFPPGGNVDVAARIVAERLQPLLGQPAIIENKPGAGGLIAGEFVAKSDPDGHTLFVGANGPVLFAPIMAGRRAYEWRNDFAPISTLTVTPIILQVKPALPAKDMKELVDLARSQPGKLNMAAPGAGSTNHLMSELMQSLSGLSLTTIQYKGNAPPTNDLVAGHVDFNFDQISVALPFVQNGKTRALAITGAARHKSLPDVPTFSEAGFGNIDGLTFTALLAPAKTPSAAIERLNGALRTILAEDTVRAKFEQIGSQALHMTPGEFRQYLEKEDARWLPVVKKLVAASK